MLQLYEIDHPGDRVTNLAQLFTERGGGYPHSWDRRLRAFGNHAGFTNSIFVKYIFPLHGLTNRVAEGEVLLLNAQPFPDPDGPGRMVISRVGTGLNDYRRVWLPERRIQQIFAEAGMEIPKALPLPPPPPAPLEEEYRVPISSRIWSLFHALSDALGLGPNGARILRLITCGALLVLIIFTVLFIWHKSSGEKLNR